MSPILVWYHAYLANGWQRLVDDQMTVLRAARIPGMLNCLAVGPDAVREFDYRVLADFPEAGIKHLEVGNEAESLNLLLCLAQTLPAETKIFYHHTKSITHENIKTLRNVTLWRRMMEYFLIERWRQCIALLDGGMDAVGCNKQTLDRFGMRTAFVGNFWWTTAGHLRRLPLIKAVGEYEHIPQNYQGEYRHMLSEFLLLSVPGNYHSMYDVDIDMYWEPCYRERYAR